jgi:hypothetical protein
MRQRKWIAAAVFAAIVLIYVTAITSKRRMALDEAPSGMRLNRAATIERTRSLAGVIWPSLQNVQITPEYTRLRIGAGSSYNPTEPVTAAWLVVCDDAHGAALGTFIWNARTGELISIVAGSNSTLDPAAGYPRLKQAEIRKVLKQWMKELTLPEQEAPWHEVSEKVASNVVSSEWVANNRVAQLHMNPASGELITYRTLNLADRALKAPGAD